MRAVILFVLLLAGCSSHEPKYKTGDCFKLNSYTYIVDAPGINAYYTHFGQIPEDQRSLSSPMDILLVDQLGIPTECPEWIKK